MGVCVKLAAETYPPSEIVFYRSFISLLMMVPVVRLHGITLVTPHWRFQLWRSAAGFVSLLMYFYAIFLLPLATAATLAYTSPLFLAIYLGLFRKMRLRSGMMAALGIGFAGVALLLRPTLHAEQWLGGVVGLGSGMLSGLAFFNIRELSERGEPEARTVFYFSLFSTVASGLWMLLYKFHPLDLRGGLLLLGVGGFATAAQLAMDPRLHARKHAGFGKSRVFNRDFRQSFRYAVLAGDAFSGRLAGGCLDRRQRSCLHMVFPNESCRAGLKR